MGEIYQPVDDIRRYVNVTGYEERERMTSIPLDDSGKEVAEFERIMLSKGKPAKSMKGGEAPPDRWNDFAVLPSELPALVKGKVHFRRVTKVTEQTDLSGRLSEKPIMMHHWEMGPVQEAILPVVYVGRKH